jgi:hypothetical protein
MVGSNDATQTAGFRDADDIIGRQAVARSGETAVFYGDAEQVGLGFAIAIEIMEEQAGFPIMPIERD